MAGGKNKINDYNKSLSPEQRKAAAKRASDASAKKRREERLWKESVSMIVSGIITDETAEIIREKFNLEDNVNVTHQDAIISALTDKAKRGDKEAAQFLRDTVGQNPQVMLKVGNLEDKPFKTLDLGSLTDDQLRQLADKEQPEEV